MNFPLKLAYHKVYFSAAWCKRSLLYDQTIEDINIFSPAFFGWVEGGGSTYLVAQLTPLSPIAKKKYQMQTNTKTRYILYH